MTNNDAILAVVLGWFVSDLRTAIKQERFDLVQEVSERLFKLQGLAEQSAKGA